MGLGAYDLYLVAGPKLGAKGRQATVDFGAYAGVSDLGVNGVGEVDRARALGQHDQVALWRKTEDLVLKHLELGVLEEFFGIGRVIENFEEFSDPPILAAIGDGVLLVGPVRGNPEIRHLPHLSVAYLGLDTLLLGADDGRVQSAIAVWLREGDVVLEAAGYHGMGAVYGP